VALTTPDLAYRFQRLGIQQFQNNSQPVMDGLAPVQLVLVPGL
jgi:hypothetical protein